MIVEHDPRYDFSKAGSRFKTGHARERALRLGEAHARIAELIGPQLEVGGAGHIGRAQARRGLEVHAYECVAFGGVAAGESKTVVVHERAVGELFEPREA